MKKNASKVSNLFPFLLFYFLLFTFNASAQGSDPGPASFEDLQKIFKTIFNIATSIAIIAVFIMLLYGGFKYLTSMGDPKGSEAAKTTITQAIIGLALMIGAWFIIKFIQVFTNVNITEFSIMLPK